MRRQGVHETRDLRALVFVQWECFVAGPPDTPYEGGVFRAVIQFPSDYPLSPVRALA